MNTTTYTPAEFAAEFPRANGHDDAIRYIAVLHHPSQIVRAADISSHLTLEEAAVQVGYTNKSRSKKITRFAVVSGNPAGML